MPTRIISTKLAIEGQSEYQNAIKSINSEYKTLQSSLKVVQSEYQTNANSTEALKAKSEALSAVLGKQQEKVATLEKALQNAQKAQADYVQKVEEAKQKIEATEKALSGLNTETEDGAKQQEILSKELEEAKRQLEYEEAALTAANRGVNSWQQELNNATVTVNNLDRELAENNKYLSEAEKSTDGCATSIDEFGKKVKEAGNDTDDFGKKSKDAVEGLANAMIAAGVKDKFEDLVSAITQCVDASIEFESALTGVFKTVDGTEEQLAQITQEIKNMSLVIPASTTEIAGVAEAAGQLGIKTQDITNFTEVMVNLGVATNMTSDNAATMLAQFANITGMDASNYERLGSTIVALGNNSATSESKIVDMAKGLAATANIAGFSETEILAISAAVSSLGIEAQAGSTSMSKMISMLHNAVELGGDDLEMFASVAGMTAAEFQVAWGTDAVGALNAFIQGLNDTERNGASATVMLNEMEISEVRLVKAVLSLANAGDLLTNSVEIANKAWDENTALTEEASKRYATTESKMQLFTNAVNLTKIAVGDELKPALNDLLDVGTNVANWATGYVQNNPGTVSAIVAVAAALGTVIVAISGFSIVQAITPLISTFMTALVANPLGAVAVGLAAIVAAIAAFSLTTKDANEEVKTLAKAAQETAAAYQEAAAGIDEQCSNTNALVSKLQELVEAENKTAAEKEIILGLVEELNAAVPELALAYDAETDSLNMTADAIRALVQEEAKRQKYESAKSTLIKLYQEEIEITESLASATEGLAKSEERLAAAKENAKSGWEAANADLEDAEKEYRLAKEAVDLLSAALEANEAATIDAAAAVDAYVTATESAPAATNALADGFATAEEKILALADAYDIAWVKADESISRQIGLFQKMNAEAEQSTNDLAKALESQTDYYADYMENLAKAVELGVNEGLISQLMDGSEESAKYLAAIGDSSEKEVARLNKAFLESEEGRKNLISTVTQMQIDFDDQMAEIVSSLEETVKEMDMHGQAWESGVSTVGGLIEGVLSRLGEAELVGQRLAKAVMESYNKTLDINSPARAMIEPGRMTVQGVIVGMEQEKAAAEDTMAEIALSAQRAMNRAVPQENYAAVGASSAAISTSKMEKLLADIEKKIEKMGNGSATPVFAPSVAAGRMMIESIRMAEKAAGIT